MSTSARSRSHTKQEREDGGKENESCGTERLRFMVNFFLPAALAVSGAGASFFYTVHQSPTKSKPATHAPWNTLSGTHCLLDEYPRWHVGWPSTEHDVLEILVLESGPNTCSL